MTNDEWGEWMQSSAQHRDRIKRALQKRGAYIPPLMTTTDMMQLLSVIDSTRTTIRHLEKELAEIKECGPAWARHRERCRASRTKAQGETK